MTQIGILVLVGLLIVGGLWLILRDHPGDDYVQYTVNTTTIPATTAIVEMTPTPVPTDLPPIVEVTAVPEGAAIPEATQAPVQQQAADEPTLTPEQLDALLGGGGSENSGALPEETAPTSAPQAVQRPAGELRSVRFRVTGDIMCTDKQLAQAKRAGNGSYDFTSQLDQVFPYLQNADYTIGNLETTIGKYGKHGYSGYPQFNTPESLLDTLKAAGYDFLTLGNNHMLDRWFDGMKNTVAWVEQYGFDHVGAYRTKQERNSPVIVEINGIRFGFLAYVQTTNTMENYCDPAAKEYGVPYLSTADFTGDVQRLRSAGAEYVIALPHMGTEYERTPDSTQKKYAQRLADAGVDLILSSHPHMVQPLGTIQTTVNGAAKSVPIIWCLGNFVTSHEVQYTDWGIILEVVVSEQPDGGFAVTSAGYIPTYCCVQNDYLKVLPMKPYIENRPSGMSDKAYNRMCQAFKEAQATLGSLPLLET
ncbi:MAG: CapA family protein [Clostridia bacterium]|nr:CapA family protein [Clostridia bacterium]